MPPESKSAERPSEWRISRKKRSFRFSIISSVESSCCGDELSGQMVVEQPSEKT
jgi:hypothetical protein